MDANFQLFAVLIIFLVLPVFTLLAVQVSENQYKKTNKS